jgi:hypothetical protein
VKCLQTTEQIALKPTPQAKFSPPKKAPALEKGLDESTMKFYDFPIVLVGGESISANANSSARRSSGVLLRLIICAQRAI